MIEKTSIFDKLAPVALIVGALLTAVAFVLTFTTAGLVKGAEVDGVILIGDQMVANKLLMSQKIFYFHVPVAITSFVALTFTAIYSVLFLKTRHKRFDTRARITAEIALVFIACTMATGELWTRFEWGIWWTWDPRLTTYLILMLLVIAYFIVRAAVDDEERCATYSAVLGIIIFVNVPLCFMITRLVPSSIHPVVFRTDSGLSPDMLIPFLLAFFGMFLLAFALYRLRLRLTFLSERVAAIKEALDERNE